jgi:TPR repeat protein
VINKPEAVRLYREAAAAGHPLAKPFVAMTYFFGNGVPQDKTQAEKLTRGTYASVLEVAKKNDPTRNCAWR